MKRLTFMLILSGWLFANPGDAYSLNHAFVTSCQENKPGSCHFMVFSKSLNLKDKTGENLDFYLGDTLAYRGRINQVSPLSNGEFGSELVMEGRWWLKDGDRRRVVEEHTQLSLVPTVSRAMPASLDGNAIPEDDDPIARALSLRNDQGRPVFSVFGKMGSPLSPVSRNGLGIEYSPKMYLPLEISTGTYASRHNAISNEPQKSLRNTALSAGLLLGQTGSQLKVGLTLVHSKVSLSGVYHDGESFAKTREFFGAVPTIGVRFTSDSYYMLSIDFGKYFGIKGELKEFVGETPTSNSLLDNSKELTVIGLGFGI